MDAFECVAEAIEAAWPHHCCLSRRLQDGGDADGDEVGDEWVDTNRVFIACKQTIKVRAWLAGIAKMQDERGIVEAFDVAMLVEESL